MTEIDALALFAYSGDWDVTEVVINLIGVLFNVWQAAFERRRSDPESFPGGVSIDITEESLVRRILVGLLDAGWTAPDSGKITPDLRCAADRMERLADAELLALFGDDLPPADYLTTARAGFSRPCQAIPASRRRTRPAVVALSALL